MATQGLAEPAVPGRRRDRIRVAAIGAVVLAVVGTLGALGSHGYPGHKPRLMSGAAWLASSTVGQLTLLDGASAEVAAQVQVAPGGDHLDVVQLGADAYAADQTNSTIRRVDGATFHPTPAVTPIPQAGAGLQALASPNVLYALDTKRGVLTGTDPKTLAGRGPLLPLAVKVTPQATALDSHGRLWVLDTTNGDLIWLDQGRRHVRHHAVDPGDGAVLTLADDTPVLVDPQARTATPVDPQTGDPDRATTLDLRPDDRIQIGGASHAQRLYVVSARGVLVVCDLIATNCSTAVPIGATDADLGTPVETAGRVFIPDYGTGQVWIVDLGSSRVIAKPQVVDAQTRFQLLTRDGVVFFNDPASEHAGVIRFDGGVRKVPKYDPRAPGKGLTPSAAAGGGNPGTAPQSAPPPVPPVPPTTQPPTSSTTPPSRPNTTPHTVQIVVSTTRARVDESVVLKVIATSGPAPRAAQWSFGDGGTSGGLLVNHPWKAAGSYQVSVQATFPDGRSAVASVTVQVTTLPRLTVTVGSAGTVTGGGITCPPTCQVTVNPGTAVQLTAVPNGTGSTFTGWQGGCTGSVTTCTVTVTADTDVSATFAGPPATAPVTVTVGGSGTGTVASQPAGIACPPTCSAPFTVGTPITLTATAGKGSTVRSWGGPCAGSPARCQLTVQAGGAQVPVTFGSNPPVLCQGQATIPGTFHLGLVPPCGVDTTTGSTSGDLWWHQVDTTIREMAPANGSSIVRIGVRSSAQFAGLTWDDLQGLTYGTAGIDGSDTDNLLQDGTVFAVSAGGHVAKLRVISHNYTDTPWSRDITLAYVTYT